jgi:hypothetical protein
MYKNESGSLNDPRTTESLTNRLFSLAGHKILSGTSFGIFLPNRSCYEKSTSNKKMYIPILINKFRLVGFLNSGSNICIISKSVTNWDSPMFHPLGKYFKLRHLAKAAFQS